MPAARPEGDGTRITTPDEPVKVLLVGTSTEFGGMERIICQLGAELVSRDWTVRLLFPESESSGKISALCTEVGISSSFVPSAAVDVGSDTSVFQIRDFFRIVRGAAPRIVHLNYGESFISLKQVLAVRLAGSVCVVNLHGISPWNKRSLRKRVATFFASRLCEKVLVNSAATRRAAQRAGVPSGKLEIVHCGIPPANALLGREEARRELDLPPDAFIVASAGRLIRQKRMDEVIRAVAEMPPSGRPVLHAVAGEGEERANLEALAKRSGAPVRFLGYLPSLAAFYAAADVFVLPSEGEAFGLVYVEAAQHGLPSIGVDQGGVPDVISDGESGFLVPANDHQALVNALVALRDTPGLSQRMGEAARERAREHFTLDRMADRVTGIYRLLHVTGAALYLILPLLP
ncbi:MAG TPA: glycosyltransferase family 4 protein [Armatimonadaceae bacterium]|nr:glycosyltransferase family 4 protein [Armatimonadaceae bacterium]